MYYAEGMHLYWGVGMDQSMDPSGMQRGRALRRLAEKIRDWWRKPKGGGKGGGPGPKPTDPGMWSCIYNCPSPCPAQVIRRFLGVRGKNPCRKTHEHRCQVVACDKDGNITSSWQEVTCIKVNHMFAPKK